MILPCFCPSAISPNRRHIFYAIIITRILCAVYAQIVQIQKDYIIFRYSSIFCKRALSLARMGKMVYHS